MQPIRTQAGQPPMRCQSDIAAVTSQTLKVGKQESTSGTSEATVEAAISEDACHRCRQNIRKQNCLYIMAVVPLNSRMNNDFPWQKQNYTHNYTVNSKIFVPEFRELYENFSSKKLDSHIEATMLVQTIYS